MAQLRRHIPLLQVLKELTGYQRQIVMDHLDLSSCNALAHSVSTVLHKGQSSVKNKKRIARLIRANKSLFSDIVGTRICKKNCQKKKRALARVGGNPLGAILSTGIPLLLSLL